MTKPLDLNEIALPWDLVSRDTEKRLRGADINNLQQAIDFLHETLMRSPNVGKAAAKEVNAVRKTVRMLAEHVRREWTPIAKPDPFAPSPALQFRAGSAMLGALLTTMTALADLALAEGHRTIERDMRKAISQFIGPDAKIQKGKS